MNKPLPIVKLGDLLKHRKKAITLQLDAEYRELTVRLWGKGVVMRRVVRGAELAASRRFVAKAGQFVLSRIDARNGALGLVPNELDGAIVTNDFPVFDIDNTKLLPMYLCWLSRTANFVEMCQHASEGTTNRVRLQEKRFLALEIPLPSLAVQQRIVARVGQLAIEVRKAQNLRMQAIKEAEALHLSALHEHFVKNASAWQSMPMTEAVEISDKQVSPKLPEYSSLPHISGENMESTTCRLLPYRTAEEDGVKSNNYLFSPGTVLYSKIRPYLRKAVYVDFRGVCSADVYPIRVITPKLAPPFLTWALVAEPFTDYANELSGRTRMPKLNRKQLFGFNLSYPPLPEQHRIVAELNAIQAEVARLKTLQSNSAAELEALLPAILDRALNAEL